QAPAQPPTLASCPAYTAPRQQLIIRGDWGGAGMAIPSARVPPEAGSTHVWSQLDVALRQQAISVVAPMAFNVVKTSPKRSQEERHDAHRPQPDPAPQRALDPSRSGLCAPVDPHPRPRKAGHI